MKRRRFILWATIVLPWLHVSDGYAVDPLANWTWRNPLPAGNTLAGVTHAANRFVAVGDQGVILVSPDGTNWTTRSSATHNTLNDITHGHGLFVAVGANGTILTSADAQAWETRSSGVTADLNAVAFGNDRFVAMGGGGSTILTSTDGFVWLQAPFQTNGLIGIAFGAGRFLTIRHPSGQVLGSVDGLAWSVAASLGSGSHLRIHFGNGTFVVASILGGIGFPARIFFSNNGSDWNSTSPPFPISRFISGGGVILGVGDTSSQFFGIALSTTGQSWTNVSIAGFPSGGAAGTFGNGTYVDVGNAGSVASSSDINNWTNHLYGSLYNIGGESMSGIAASSNVVVTVGAHGMHVSTNNSPFALVPGVPVLNDVTYGLGSFVAVGGSSVFKSSDGINWTPRPSGTPNGLTAVTSGPDGFVAVGGGGTIQSSSTGQTWAGRFSPVQYNLHGVAFDRGLYVAVGDSGTVLTSSNSIDWEVQDSGTLISLRDVAGGSAGFVAVGDQGTILTSSNAINWTQRLSGHWLFDTVSFGNGFYVAGGFYWPEDFVFSSIDGLTWKRQYPAGRLALIFSRALGSTFDGTHFLLAGQGGTVLQSGSTDTPMLSARALADDVCEITIAGGTAGSVYTLQSCSQLRTAWRNLITFTNAGSSTCYSDVDAKSSNKLFYRVVQTP
jgi:hypothetical protein